MSARDFTDPRGWGAFHIVHHASKNPYELDPRGDPRPRNDNEIILEEVFFFRPIDDLHVRVERTRGGETFSTTADTPISNPPTISFTLTEDFSYATVKTEYAGYIVDPTAPIRTILCPMYRRTVLSEELLLPDDELGTWTGNNPPPEGGDFTPAQPGPIFVRKERAPDGKGESSEGESGEDQTRSR